jgi:ABC-type nitrate/sulfonate/bicarbonate transport system substrate-binding protein
MASLLAPVYAETTLRIVDQKGNVRSVLEAAGALDGIPYAIEWREFAAAAPLLEAANAGAIDVGTVGHAVPIEESVVEEEQKTIDLYVRAGLLKERLTANDLFDKRFSAASAAEPGQ